MAELSVIIILALGALATAGWTVIRLVRLLPAETEDDRLNRALQSAAQGVARRQSKLVAIALTLSAVTSLAALELLTARLVWWMLLGLLLGTVSVFLVSQVSVALSIHSASAAARLAGSGDQAIVLSLRSGASLTALAGVVALLIGGGMLALVRTTRFDIPFELAAGTVIGSLATALVLHTTGASLRLAAVTSRTSSPQSGRLPHYCLDSSNPSLVLDLVAQHTGAAQTHGQRVFFVFCLQQMFALIVASRGAISAPALLATTLLSQGCALLSSGTIQAALRASDGVRTWPSALSRGVLANAVLCVVAVTGAGYWLLAETFRPSFAIYAALGAALTLSGVAFQPRASGRHAGRLEEQDVTRRPSLDVTFGVSAALQSSALAAAALVGAIALVTFLAPDAAAFGEALWWLTMGCLVSLPFLEAQGQLEALTEATASLASLRADSGRGEPHAQLASLCAVGQQAGSGSQRGFAVVSGVLVMLGLTQLTSSPSVSPSLAAQVVQALAALAILFATLGGVSRHAALTALSGASEISRQQRSDDTAPKPSYARFVEELTDKALRGGVWTSYSSPPVVLLAVVLLASWGDTQSGAMAAPTTFLAFVAAGGISVSLLGVGIAAFVRVTRGFRRVTAGPTSTPLSDSLNTAHVVLADLVGFVLPPAALVLVHLTLAVALVVTPFVR